MGGTYRKKMEQRPPTFRDIRYRPSCKGVLNTVFPIELVGKIWYFMTIVDLLRYALTSKGNYNDVHNAIRDSVHRILARFCISPVRFLQVLQAEQAVVSGSVSLYAMHAITFDANSTIEGGWVPEDIDIYIPLPENKEGPPPFVNYMIETRL